MPIRAQLEDKSTAQFANHRTLARALKRKQLAPDEVKNLVPKYKIRAVVYGVLTLVAAVAFIWALTYLLPWRDVITRENILELIQALEIIRPIIALAVLIAALVFFVEWLSTFLAFLTAFSTGQKEYPHLFAQGAGAQPAAPPAKPAPTPKAPKPAQPAAKAEPPAKPSPKAAKPPKAPAPDEPTKAKPAAKKPAKAKPAADKSGGKADGKKAGKEKPAAEKQAGKEPAKESE